MPAKKTAPAVPTDMPDVLDLKIETLTIDEIDAIEEITGQPLDALNKPGQKRAPMLKAMAYVVMKRKHPDFSIEDAGALRINLKGKAKPDPTAANA